jgi:hypothetical protein
LLIALLLGRIERDPAMMLAVRVARTLKRATEAEMRLPRIANRPAAVVVLKIDDLLGLLRLM